MGVSSRRGTTRDSWDSFGNLLVRIIFIGLGVVLLEQYRFQNLFGSILGLALAVGPIVTVESVQVRIESILKITSNRISQKIIGKEVFITEQRDFSAQTVIGHLHGDLIQPAPDRQEKQQEERVEADDWAIARDFTLPGAGDSKEFRLKLSRGDHLKGYVKSSDQVCSYVLTQNSRQSFQNGYGFTPLWDSEWETYAKVDFVTLKSGTYYLVVTNEPDEEEAEYYDDLDIEDADVELRLKH
jgi:hypothetical protein